MGQTLSSLAERKFLAVTGKGGAGKSLLSCALAHRLAKNGKNVLLVELGRKRDQAFSRLPEILGTKKLEHEPRALSFQGTRFQAALLDPTQSLAEYVDLKLPTGGLAGMLLNNKVTASFLEVVPGLPDLVTLGKLWHTLTSPSGIDTVILDGPASGHALSLLKAPENFRQITKTGPIHKDASMMTSFFADPKSTAVVIVSLPEEMALREAEETAALMRKTLPEPLHLVNKCFPPLHLSPQKDSSPLWGAYDYAYRRAQRERGSLKEFQANYESLPFLFPDPNAPPLFLRLSEHL